MQDEHPGTRELGDRLEAYASARLSPDRGAAARVRAAVLEEARMRALETQIGGTRHRHESRRDGVVALFLAASLALGAAVGVAAAGPGSPFFGARVWVEAALLPADADARALERIRQLEERLVDAEQAIESGDAATVAAAIQAYREAVDAATDEVGTDASRLNRLEAALGLHVVVLEALSATLPDAADHGIERALEASRNAVDKIKHVKPDADTGSNPDPETTPKPGRTDPPGRSSPDAPDPTPRGNQDD